MKLLYITLLLPLAIQAGLRGHERNTMEFTIGHNDNHTHHHVESSNGTLPPDIITDVICPRNGGIDGCVYYECPNPSSIAYANENPIGEPCHENTDCSHPDECCLLPRCVCGKHNSNVTLEFCHEDMPPINLPNP